MKTEMQINRAEAQHGKQCLQSALDLVNRARAMMLPGPQSDQLDHASRMIVVGITVLRDADRVAMEGARLHDFERKTPAKRDRSFENRTSVKVKCPTCERVFESRALNRTSCGCGQMSINVKKHQVKTP